MKHSQQGVGMIEVIVALVILAIGVLGFSAMQLRAASTTNEAINNVYATSIARDLAERMRVNRKGLERIQADTGVFANPPDNPRNCATAQCNSLQMAQYDYAQVRARATTLGMQVAVHACPRSTLVRSCVYVSWGDTNPNIGNDNNPDGGMNCTNNQGVYHPKAQCVFMEIYNRV